MLNLILIDVQYSQKAVFSFEEGSNHQNHSSSNSPCLVKNSQSAKFLSTPNPSHPYRYLENPDIG